MGSARRELGEALARLSPPQREELSENVASSLKARERELEKQAEEKRRTVEAQRRRLEEERAEALRRAQADTENRVKEGEARRLERELKERGFVAERGSSLVVTFGLVQRFARLLLDEETRKLPADARMSLKGEGSTGVYEKARLRRAVEVAHLDVPGSLLAARLAGQRHIEESTSYVYREITSERVHVVLAFDRSGSMAEAGKLDAAKKALLALYVAIRRRHPDATIDLLAFDNEVEVLDLVTLWECSAGSFTNTAEALRAAHLLLRSSRANRREVYLLTDGLPEAYTGPDGRVHSGQLDRAMEQALVRAAELATVRPLRATMILLKSPNPAVRARRPPDRADHGRGPRRHRPEPTRGRAPGPVGPWRRDRASPPRPRATPPPDPGGWPGRPRPRPADRPPDGRLTRLPLPNKVYLATGPLLRSVGR